MRLYSGTTVQFINDNIQNQIAEKLRSSFYYYYGFNPSIGEVHSWQNSLKAFSQTVQYSGLDDHGIILEYQLPLTSKRLDCLISGRNVNDEDNAVIVELKQWEKCEPSDAQNEVCTWINGAHRDILHPSVQVGQYRLYLEDTHTAFYDGSNPIQLHSCAYLHNYHFQADDAIFDSKFQQVISENPVFTANDVDKLKDYLQRNLSRGNGLEVLKKIEQSKYRASKKLMDHVGNVIKGNSGYILLDEQKIVFDRVFAEATRSFHDKQKSVVIVKGGPGTGKSVIAINLMADLLLKGYNSHYATGSRAFTETLRDVIGRRGSVQFKYFNSYMQAENNEVDVLICDEAHRIRKTSNNRFTPASKKSDMAQIDEIIRAAKVSVFFIDDRQVVRPDEIGSVDYIKESASAHKCKIIEFEELETQFRCNGSDGFVNWINNTLGIKRTANAIWNQNEETFDFRIFDSPESLEQAIIEKNNQGYKARLTAGFCWNWSEAKNDGTLVNDVVIGDFSRPWNAKPEAKKLAADIPKATLWAHDPNGLNQVGCIYTAQGFEFDYVGVIFGEDLIYDLEKQGWFGNRSKSADNTVKRSKENFIDLVKNTYRVLTTRGMKGCYVYFMDKSTELYFKSRIEKSTLKGELIHIEPEQETNGILEEINDNRKFKDFLPVYSLKAVATNFIREEYVEQLGWMKVNEQLKLGNDMFIAQVVGRSMEPTIKDGAFCVFRFERGGSRNGKVVLVESRHVSDPESLQSYTIKRYRSKKVYQSDGTWIHEKIILSPDNIDFEDIILENVNEDEFKVVAEFISVLD